MLTNDQITALAREYAEEATKADASDPELSATDLNDIKHDVAEYAENAIRFLLRRYFLVEKSVIKKTWSEITNVYLAHQHITYDGARYLFDEVLFPDRGREVKE